MASPIYWQSSTRLGKQPGSFLALPFPRRGTGDVPTTTNPGRRVGTDCRCIADKWAVQRGFQTIPFFKIQIRWNRPNLWATGGGPSVQRRFGPKTTLPDWHRSNWSLGIVYVSTSFRIWKFLTPAYERYLEIRKLPERFLFFCFVFRNDDWGK